MHYMDIVMHLSSLALCCLSGIHYVDKNMSPRRRQAPRCYRDEESVHRSGGNAPPPPPPQRAHY
jgi:hypothetical protein